jgi:hypothetical protein
MNFTLFFQQHELNLSADARKKKDIGVANGLSRFPKSPPVLFNYSGFKTRPPPKSNPIHGVACTHVLLILLP